MHRYIFRELLRVFLFAVVGLTLILSLGSILQPVQEYGVGPKQVVHLMGYFLPITLTFVLPMAALFAGALIYGRFASDNELDACRASGISLITLTFPGLVLAVIVAIANLFLSFYVMPVFVHRAEKSLKADAKQIIFRNIQRRRYYELPSEGKTLYLIYADQTNMKNNTLLGVIVAEMKDNEIKRITTAGAAQVLFRMHDTFNEVQITAYESSQMGPGGEGGAGSFSMTKEFGSLLGDEIQFKKLDEMRRISADMMRFYPIEKLARQTYTRLILELLARDIQTWIDAGKDLPRDDRADTAQSENNNRFYELLGTPNSVKLTFERCEINEEAIDLSGEITIVEYDTTTKQPINTLTCTKTSLHLEGDLMAPTLALDVQSPQQTETGELKLRHVIQGLILPRSVQKIASEFKTRSGSLKLDKLASEVPELAKFEPGGKLKSSQAQLEREIKGISLEIKSEIHSRLVFGAGCIPMILIGIGLGILKKGGHLLSAFGASCIPAATLVVCILSGKQLTENLNAQTISGITLMWAGLGFLCVLALGIFGWLTRH